MRIKILILGLACLSLLSSTWIQEKTEAKTQEETVQKTHFRNTYWGMNKEKVIKIEGEPSDSKTAQGLDMILYESDIDNKKCAIIFVFVEDKLVRSKYHFLHNHVNKNLYIHDYGSIKKFLIEKYGKPKEDKTIWLNNLYKDDSDDWGDAIGYGHLRYYAEWETPETNISLGLLGDNREINLAVEYKSIKYRELEEKAKEKAKKKIW